MFSLGAYLSFQKFFGFSVTQRHRSLKLWSALWRRYRAGDEQLMRTTGLRYWVGVRGTTVLHSEGKDRN